IRVQAADADAHINFIGREAGQQDQVWAIGVDDADRKLKISSTGLVEEASHALGAGGSFFMTIDTAGLVGIGTTSPDYLLDVDGDFRVGEQGSTNNTLFVDATAGTVSIGTNAAAGRTTIQAGSRTQNALELKSSDATGDAEFTGLLFDTIGTDVAGIYTDDFDNYISIAGGDGVDLKYGFAGISSGTLGLRLASTGNVGIGTTTPVADLTIHQSSVTQGIGGILLENTANTRSSIFQGGDDDLYIWNFEGGFKVATQNSGPDFTIDDNGVVSIVNAGSAPAPTLNFNDANTGIYATAASELRVAIDGQDYITLSNSSTGIVFNEDQADRDFSIVDSTGSTGFFHDATNGNVGISSTTPWGTLSVEDTGTDGVFVVGDAGVDEPYLYIDTDGKIGMGTANPSYMLHMTREDADNTYLYIDNTNASGYGSGLLLNTLDRQWVVSASDNASGVDAAGAFGVYDSTASAWRFTIDSTGYISIGDSIANATMPLHVYDTKNEIAMFRGDNHAAVYIDGSDGSDKSLIWSEATVDKWRIGMENAPTDTTDDFSIKQTNDGTPEFIIKTSGNVGIGTSTPD
ncbi:MAG: hypothetical protein QF535_19005, partial [Anaerolineales bacterium]|nr:hypothetical protein [Anaerolineales bacterium]